MKIHKLLKRYGLNSRLTITIYLGGIIGAILPILFFRLVFRQMEASAAWTAAIVTCIIPTTFIVPISLFGLAAGMAITLGIICLRKLERENNPPKDRGRGDKGTAFDHITAGIGKGTLIVIIAGALFMHTAAYKHTTFLLREYYGWTLIGIFITAWALTTFLVMPLAKKTGFRVYPEK